MTDPIDLLIYKLIKFQGKGKNYKITIILIPFISYNQNKWNRIGGKIKHNVVMKNLTLKVPVVNR